MQSPPVAVPVEKKQAPLGPIKKIQNCLVRELFVLKPVTLTGHWKRTLKRPFVFLATARERAITKLLSTWRQSANIIEDGEDKANRE